LVVALGLGLTAVASGVNLLMLDRFDNGWFTYAPNTGVTVSDAYYRPVTDRAIVEQGLVWLAALALWTGVSCWLLRPGAASHG
jgi:hypothetical protein